MISPDIFAIYQAGKKYLIPREAVSVYKLTGLFALYKIKAYSGKWHIYDIFIHIPHITEVCLEKYLTVCTICKYPVIHPVEKCLIIVIHISHQ